MCGINGIYAYREGAPPVDAAELLRVRDTMVKRGPDGAGAWLAPDRRVGLANRRLAIIDLSEAGAQPMASADGRLVVVFNGEIYNHGTLRRELQASGARFRSSSDTEVLLHLYERHGEDMLGRLRGMYAFAIWDSTERRLFLARDPFGIKPLYYADDGQTLRFGSQVKALLCGSGIDDAPEAAGAAGFLLWGYVPEPFTLYRGIRALPAGASLSIAHGRVRSQTHFSLRDELRAAQQRGRSFDARERPVLAQALRDTVRHHLVSDVPVGVFLSAGVDSTLLSVLAAEHAGVSLRTLTLGFEEHRGTNEDEVPLARQTAALLGTRHETHWIRGDDFQDERSAILAAMDQPTTDGINTYFVCREAARAGLKVALSGLGGDELFGGYPSFRQVPRLARWLRPAALVPLVGRLARRFAHRPVSRYASPKYAGLLEYGGSTEGAYLLRRALFMPWELDQVLDPAAVRTGLARLHTVPVLGDSIHGLHTGHARVAALELGWYMRNQLLRDADWAGMAHSVEIRVPFVDIDFFRAVAPWLVSAAPPRKSDVAAAPGALVPREVLERPKSGFSVPVSEWLAGKASAPSVPGKGLRGWARTLLDQEPSAASFAMPQEARRSRPAALAMQAAHWAVNALLRGLALALWPRRRPAAAQRICIYRIGSVGDITCALPALRAVRQAYPAAHITFLSSPGARGLVGAPEVLAGIDWIDQVRTYYTDDIAGLGRQWALLRQLRRERFDLWIELPSNLSSAWRLLRDMLFTRLVGPAWARGWQVSTVRIAAGAQSVHLEFQNEVERTLQIVRDQGIPVQGVDFGLRRDPATVARIDRWLGGPASQPLAAIAPCAKRAANLWPLERFAEVGRYLAQSGIRVVVVGGAIDTAACQALVDQIGRGASSFAGKLTIAESCELLRRCEVLVCVDSGVQHLAAAVGTPCISLFSFRDLRNKWHPYGARNVVLRKWVGCHTCLRDVCPRGNLCMREIPVGEVTARLRQRIPLAHA